MKTDNKTTRVLFPSYKVGRTREESMIFSFPFFVRVENAWPKLGAHVDMLDIRRDDTRLFARSGQSYIFPQLRNHNPLRILGAVNSIRRSE